MEAFGQSPSVDGYAFRDLVDEQRRGQFAPYGDRSPQRLFVPYARKGLKLFSADGRVKQSNC